MLLTARNYSLLLDLGSKRRGRDTAQADEHDEQEPALAGNLDVFAAHGILGSDF